MIKEVEYLEEIIDGEISLDSCDCCNAFVRSYYRSRENGWDELYTKTVRHADEFCDDCRAFGFQFVRIDCDDEQIAAFEKAGCKYEEGDGEAAIMQILPA